MQWKWQIFIVRNFRTHVQKMHNLFRIFSTPHKRWNVVCKRNCPSICSWKYVLTTALLPLEKELFLKMLGKCFVEKCLFHKISRIFKKSSTNKKFSRFLGILARTYFREFLCSKILHSTKIEIIQFALCPIILDSEIILPGLSLNLI